MPSIQYTVCWRLEMSDKKSPPPKQEKILTTVKTPQSDGKTLKRKLATPGSPTEEEEKRIERTPKRKRASVGLESSPLAGSGGTNKASGGIRHGTHNVPLSERQQLAMIIRMTDDNSQDSSPKHSSPAQPPVTPGKRTPGDKKVHKRNERGETQLHIFAKKGDIKQTKKLIKAGADVNVRDFAGWTALHEACNHGCFAVAKQLLKAGAYVNVQGLDKDTPLHDASICGHRKLVQLLLKHGADPYQANSKGKTAIDVAYSEEIEKLLRRENVSSNSESSSMDERSPTSPESTTSTREDERLVDIDEFALRISSQMSASQGMTTTTTAVTRSNSISAPTSSVASVVSSTTAQGGELQFNRDSFSSSHVTSVSLPSSVAKRAVTKSPEGKNNSPRLCLKFRPSDDVNSESSNVSKDWQRPQFKSYSVTLETRERKGSPTNSASSSNESDLYDPQLDSGAKLKFSESSLHNRNNGDGKITPKISIDGKPKAVGDIGTVKTYERNSSDRGGNQPLSGSSCKPSLESIDSCQFSPQFEDISDSEQEETRLPQCTAEQGRGRDQKTAGSELSRIPVIRVSTTNDTVSKDTVSDSHVSLFPPLHRSSSFVGSPKHPIWENSQEGADRTRRNSAPNKKSIFLTDSVGFKNADISKSDTRDSDSSVADRWDSIASPALSSIPKPDLPVKQQLQQQPQQNISECSPDSPKGDVKTTRPFPVSQQVERDAVKSLYKTDMKHNAPKVPPLKIIMPTKTTSSSGQVDRAGSPFTNQPALPYVVNPSHTGDGEAGVESVSQGTSQASSTASSRPSSRASSPASDTGKVDVSKIVDRLLSQTEEEPKDTKEEAVVATTAEKVASPEPATTTNEKPKEAKVEEQEKLTMVLRDRDRNRTETDTSSKEKEQPAAPTATETKENEKAQKDNKEQKEERRTTRTLRSHTQMLLQQQKADGQDSKDTAQNDTTKEEEQQKPEETDESLTNRKRKLRPKPEPSAPEPPPPAPPVQYEKPPNPYELFLSIRSQVASRRDGLVMVAPKAPQGYKDYKIVNCSYVLHGNSASRLAVPMLTPPNSVTGPIRELFLEQEKARYKLRLQHIVEREKLMMSVEQEVLRVHGRAARAMINQNLPLGVCTILKDEEIYNIFEVEERDKNVRTRYNGRQFLSWYHDVMDKFDKIKSYLLLRHHHEAESLFAVQKMDWEWKLKELGLCDSNTTPAIDELHVPMVQVNEEFDLLPA